MYSYGLLEPGCYYLVQETTDTQVELIKVSMESDQCMYIFKYHDELISQWRRKSDPIHDIIECMSDEKVEQWQKQYNSNDAYYEEDEE